MFQAQCLAQDDKNVQDQKACRNEGEIIFPEIKNGIIIIIEIEN